MKFAEISIVRLNNDVITTSGFDFDACAQQCFDTGSTSDPCNDE